MKNKTAGFAPARKPFLPQLGLTMIRGAWGSRTPERLPVSSGRCADCRNLCTLFCEKLLKVMTINPHHCVVGRRGIGPLCACPRRAGPSASATLGICSEPSSRTALSWACPCARLYSLPRAFGRHAISVRSPAIRPRLSRYPGRSVH